MINKKPPNPVGTEEENQGKTDLVVVQSLRIKLPSRLIVRRITTLIAIHLYGLGRHWPRLIIDHTGHWLYRLLITQVIDHTSYRPYRPATIQVIKRWLKGQLRRLSLITDNLSLKSVVLLIIGYVSLTITRLCVARAVVAWRAEELVLIWQSLEGEGGDAHMAKPGRVKLGWVELLEVMTMKVELEL